MVQWKKSSSDVQSSSYYSASSERYISQFFGAHKAKKSKFSLKMAFEGWKPRNFIMRKHDKAFKRVEFEVLKGKCSENNHNQTFHVDINTATQYVIHIYRFWGWWWHGFPSITQFSEFRLYGPTNYIPWKFSFRKGRSVFPRVYGIYQRGTSQQRSRSVRDLEDNLFICNLSGWAMLI